MLEKSPVPLTFMAITHFPKTPTICVHVPPASRHPCYVIWAEAGADAAKLANKEIIDTIKNFFILFSFQFLFFNFVDFCFPLRLLGVRIPSKMQHHFKARAA